MNTDYLLSSLQTLAREEEKDFFIKSKFEKGHNLPLIIISIGDDEYTAHAWCPEEFHDALIFFEARRMFRNRPWDLINS